MQEKRTYGRWYILAIICLMYLITYLDRVVMSNTAPEIQKEFGIDNATKGVILSALFWGYSLFQVPGGWLSERFGPRAALAGLVTFWSLTTMAVGFASNWVSFAVLLFVLGAGEAGAFPGATRAMQMWYPRSERGFAQGFTHSASRFGAFIAPTIIVLIIAGHVNIGSLSINGTPLGWRWVFYICGAGGIIWSVLWYLIYRNTPGRAWSRRAARNWNIFAASTPMGGSIRPTSPRIARRCRGARCCRRRICGRSCAPT